MHWITLICLLVGPFTSTPKAPPIPPWRPASQSTRAPIATPSLRSQAPPTSPTQPISGDLVVHFYDKNISTQQLLIQLNMTRYRFNVDNLCPLSHYSCKYVCPLNDSNETQERTFQKPCYCDKLCLELGDCCYDYFLSCVADLTTKHHLSRHVCIKTNKTDFYGYTMIGSCLSNNSEKSLESLCTADSSSLELPVLDLDDNSLYKNIFCARCNRASNPLYWKFSANCNGRFEGHDIPQNRTLMLEFIQENCNWNFIVPRNNSSLRKCLAVKVPCKQAEPHDSLLSNLCAFYAFPVCKSIERKNPHCEMCRGNDISAYYCMCYKGAKPTTPFWYQNLPSLNILFDFSSSYHTVKIGEITTTVKNKECSYGFLYDPFLDQCVKEHVVERQVANNGSCGSYNNKGQSFIKVNSSSVTVFSNGSIWIPSHKRTYNNGSYFINGSSVFVNVNFTRNFTETTTMVSKNAKVRVRQMMTYVGCAISMVSLILLLGVYVTLTELRTLPGKNLMSLSTSMLLYHTVFLMTGQTNRPHLCMTVSILLHYFLLSSFCWMSVMAFDVAKTFTKKGQISRSALSGSSKAVFIKYHIYAWAVPAIIVIISFVLDTTGAVYIGYGDRICWISNGKALLVVFGIPVALILVFNCAAIFTTLLSIWKVQQSTRQVADHRTSLPILYIKLSSALGSTWLLGFIAPFAKVEFLDYAFVICNSLQGFFIFLAFVAKKRTLNKVKDAWKSLSKSDG